MPNALRKCILPLLVVAAMTSGASAQDDEEQRDEGRLQGFAKPDGKVGKIELTDARSGAGTWFILAGLGLLGVGVMFKSGKRTHLD